MKQNLNFCALVGIAASLSLGACIKDDIPYPYIHANFLSISAVGQLAPASIDSTNMRVTFRMPESANIYQVVIDDFSITPGAHVSAGNLSEPIDLSKPYEVTLSLYQDYVWTLSAVQNIERYFSVQGQMGTTVIDSEAHTVQAFVSKRVDLSAVKVESFKIAPSSASVSSDLAGQVVDFTSPVKVSVDNYGHKEEWTISVSVSQAAVTTLSADGWTCVGWVYGEAEAGVAASVQYRVKGDTEWIDVPNSWITVSGGSFYARLTGLTPSTAYEARCIAGTDIGETLEFTTGEILQLPNSDFDNWWLDGKVWCPWDQGGDSFWDTGNKGATTLGQSNTVPTDDTVDGMGQAAMLQTKFVGIGILGKLAAGNIFAGRYVRTDGTNGVLSMGREFSQRPTALKGYMKYHSAPISNTTSGFADLKGEPDTCVVWVALIDSDEPYEIRTNPSNRQLFDPSDPCVIAYGKVESGADISEYAPFEIMLEYRSTSRVPKYILCTGSASKYGDYFTGGNGSVLYLDDLELVYDY